MEPGDGPRRALAGRRADGRAHRRPGAAAADARAGCAGSASGSTSGVRWKEIAYHLAHLPVAVVGVRPVDGGVVRLDRHGAPAGRTSTSCPATRRSSTSSRSPPAAARALRRDRRHRRRSLFVAPWITVGMGRMELALARALLGPSAEEAHAAQVTQLETSRTAAVDSAEAERRRIERDLHDGAQQRLVALAANLGAAREKLDHDDIEEGRTMVAVAHEEAKSALKEIRDLVRGIHPVILEDRGLDAALSAVVARSPIPVDARRRTSPTRPPAGRRERGVLRRQRGADERRPPRHGDEGVRQHRPRRRPPRDRGARRRRRRRRAPPEDEARRGAGRRVRARRPARPGRRPRRHDVRDQPAGGPTTISVELPCGS